jgi:hypothetical protein
MGSAKTCGKCKLTLCTSEFNLKKRNKDGKNEFCKTCEKSRMAKYYQETKKRLKRKQTQEEYIYM